MRFHRVLWFFMEIHEIGLHITISNIDFSVSYGARLDIGFDVEDKQTIVLSSKIIGDDGEIIPSLDVLGKHIEDDWVKKLVDSGVINEEVYITN